jgi:hypothetical protein
MGEKVGRDWFDGISPTGRSDLREFGLDSDQEDLQDSRMD